MVPVFSPPEWVVRLVNSIGSTHAIVEVHLHLHSDSPETRATCLALADAPEVTLHAHGENRGLSRTWNDGMLAGYAEGVDVVLIVNDDVEFARGDVDRLTEVAIERRDCYIVSCAGPHGRHQQRMPSHGYSCFAINPIALEVLGCFDENLFPAYCEDQDYSRRARLAGLHEANCPDTEVFHGGSAAIFSDAGVRHRNAQSQARNMDYYCRKWGGDGDHERYERPFNDSTLGIRIPPERRHHPYGPKYDRTDRF